MQRPGARWRIVASRTAATRPHRSCPATASRWSRSRWCSSLCFVANTSFPATRWPRMEATGSLRHHRANHRLLSWPLSCWLDVDQSIVVEQRSIEYLWNLHPSIDFPFHSLFCFRSKNYPISIFSFPSLYLALLSIFILFFFFRVEWRSHLWFLRGSLIGDSSFLIWLSASGEFYST